MKLLTRLAFVLSIPFIIAADAPKAAVPLPGGIQLVAGYLYEAGHTVDSAIGRIWKDGAEIGYDIGPGAGDHAGAVKPEDRLWSIKQIVRGQQILIVKGKDKSVAITIQLSTLDSPVGYPANFWSKPASDEDLAAMILMAASYSPAH